MIFTDQLPGNRSLYRFPAWLGAGVTLMLISFLIYADPVIPPERQLQLQNMVLHDCGACHGMSMKGGLGPALTPAVLENRPEQELLDTILNGRQQTAMPPWKNFLTANEATWIVQQLKTGRITAN